MSTVWNILLISMFVKKLGTIKKHLQKTSVGWIFGLMKPLFLSLFCTLCVCIPLTAQDTLYPVRANATGLDTMHVESDPHQKEHLRYVAEKTFDFKLMVEFPTKDEAGFLPNFEAKIAMLWLRVENVSQRPMSVDPTRFTLTDDEGHALPFLPPEEAFNRINSTTLGRQTFMSSTKKALGRGTTEEDLKDETIRFSFQSGEVPGQGVKQGLIFFEAPRKKKYSVTLRLSDLWSRPMVFTTTKPKN